MDIDLSSNPILDENDQYKGSLAMLTDISQRKQIEMALKDSQARLKMAQKIGHVGSWEYDLDTGHIYGSDEGFRIYGLTSPTRS